MLFLPIWFLIQKTYSIASTPGDSTSKSLQPRQSDQCGPWPGDCCHSLSCGSQNLFNTSFWGFEKSFWRTGSKHNLCFTWVWSDLKPPKACPFQLVNNRLFLLSSKKPWEKTNETGDGESSLLGEREWLGRHKVFAKENAFCFDQRISDG